MKREGKNVFRCPLCGNVFKRDLSECPGSCPLGGSCSPVCCPRCHYQFVEESKTVNFFKRIFQVQRRSADDQE